MQSGWTGKVNLGGVDYRLALFDDLDGVFTTGSDQMSLSPWTGADGDFAFDTIALPGRLLIGNRLFDLALSLETGGNGGSVHVAITETSAPLLDVELLGTHIHSLKFGPTGGGHDATAAFVDDPSDALRLPEGAYSLRVELEGGALGPLKSKLDVVVKAGGENVIRAGGPLDNSVSFQRSSVAGFEVSHRLLGVGGEEYALAHRASTPPRFVARIGEREIASADFQFG